MRIGLLSDIHADFEGLKLALARLGERNVELILCAGDLVERGPEGNQVAALIFASPILAVRGNHDHDAEQHRDWYQHNPGDHSPFDSGLSARDLSDETVRLLKTLPPTRVIPAGKHRILLAHGTPWNDTLYLFPGTGQPVYRRVANYAREVGADIVVVGHTHVPMRAEVDGVLILNPGSVCGTYAQGSRTCGVLTLPSMIFEALDIESGTPVRLARPIFEMDVTA